MTRVRALGAETFRSLRIRNHRMFFVGQALSQNGTWMQLVAIDILVLRITDDGLAVGLATAARLAPILLLGAWGGLLSDRKDRHKLLLWLNMAGAAVATVFAVMVATDTATLAWIYTLAAAAGTVTAIENPTRRAFVVDLVPDEEVTNAVGLNSAMMTGSRIVGPAVAGVLITTVGIRWCFAVNALTFLPQLWLFARLDRSRFRPTQRLVPAKGQLREGFRYVWNTPHLRLPILLVAVTGAMNFNYPAILPLFATRDLDAGAGTYTLLLSVMSVGSMLGGLTVARRVEVGIGFLARSALALAGFSFVLALAPVTGAAAAAAVPIGLTTMLVNSGANSIVQLSAIPEMRGRVLAIVAVVFVGSAPVGAPLMGWVAEHAGARWALALGGVAALAAGAGTLRAHRRVAGAVPRSEPADVRAGGVDAARP